MVIAEVAAGPTKTEIERDYCSVLIRFRDVSYETCTSSVLHDFVEGAACLSAPGYSHDEIFA